MQGRHRAHVAFIASQIDASCMHFLASGGCAVWSLRAEAAVQTLGWPARGGPASTCQHRPCLTPRVHAHAAVRAK